MNKYEIAPARITLFAAWPTCTRRECLRRARLWHSTGANFAVTVSWIWLFHWGP